MAAKISAVSQWYLWWRLLPAQQGADGDDDGENPDAQHGEQRPLLCDDHGVLQRVADANVAVDGDDAQGHDGCRATQDVHSCPDVTEYPAEHPIIQHLTGASRV